jgi:hypothetical protein
MPDLIHRRELLKIASAALAGLTSARSSWSMPPELVQSVANAADWKPVFFNPHQNETVAVLTNLIIPRTDTPGANDAKVHRYIDLFLSVGNAADQKQFVDGLAWLDDSSKQAYKQEFVKCSEEQQIALLTRVASADKEKMSDTGHAFFGQAKNMTSMIYFSTAEGYKELNKFGPPPSTFACEHPAGHSH